MSEQGTQEKEQPQPDAPEKPQEPANAAPPSGETKPAAENPDVATIVIQFNRKTFQQTHHWPKNVTDTCTLYGMLGVAFETLVRGQLVRDVTTGVVKGIAERMAIKGRGGMKFPTPDEIARSARH